MAKTKADTVERTRAWAKSNSMYKAEITRGNSEAT